MTALEILNKYWNHNTFRQPQEQIIESILQGKDTLALMPTGGGKSVCFQVPAMVKEGICLVISPLIALIKDQVENLKAKNIKAIGLYGGLSYPEIDVLLDNCSYGNYKFLYLSPERLENEWIIERLTQLPINLIAIDEAHCVSQWGHDFRPSYLKIKKLKDVFKNVPFLALTATATKRVKEDILKELSIPNAHTFTKSFHRKNISYKVIIAENKWQNVFNILEKNKLSSIIYVRNRRSCIEICNLLIQNNFTATYYHGGLTIKEKENNMHLWLSNKTQVMVATNAFGMGIDKPDVQTVIHTQLPENLENYYQEAGRAGRNNEPASGYIIAHKSDVEITKKQFIEVLPDKTFLKEVYRKLNNYFQVAYGEGFGETFNFNIQKFCAQYNFSVPKCLNALLFLDRQGIISYIQQSSNNNTLQFIVSGKEVLRYISLHKKDEDVVTYILRNYIGIFDSETNINISLIAKKNNLSEENVNKILEKLHHQEIAILKQSSNDSSITFNVAREDDLTINPTTKYLEKYNQIKKEQLDNVLHYVFTNNECKTKILLRYFNENFSANCNNCSYCMSKNSNTNHNALLYNDLLLLLKQKSLNVKEIEKILPYKNEDIISCLSDLLEENKISISTKNTFYAL